MTTPRAAPSPAEDDRIKTPPGANPRVVAALGAVRRVNADPTAAPTRPLDAATTAALSHAGRLQQQGRATEAITFLEAMEPTAPVAHRLAVLVAQQGDLARAERFVQAALDAEPANEEYATALKVILTKRALRR